MILLKFYGMKIITIGRGEDCNIILSDPVISRKHALLKIYPTGKMEIVDMGQNGTYVNGVRLAPNTPYPVTRKDVISFAQVRQLDWKSVPDNMLYIKYVLAGVAVILVLVLALFIKNRIAAPDVPKMEEVQKTEKTTGKEKADDAQKSSNGNDGTGQGGASGSDKGQKDDGPDKKGTGDDTGGQTDGDNKPDNNKDGGSEGEKDGNDSGTKQELNAKPDNGDKFKNKVRPKRVRKEEEKKTEKKTENKEENKEEENNNNSFIL